MSKRLITLMAALAVLGFAAAGCGGDDEAASTVTDAVTDQVTDVVTDDEVVTDTETVTEQTDTDATAESGGAAVPQSVEEAVERCKQAVTSYPQLSGDTKSQLEDLCERAGSGDADRAREAGQEVCRKIIEDLYPSGVPGKDKALAACEQGVQ